MEHEMNGNFICLCGHPQNWHEREKVKKVCIGKFCACPRFESSFIKYDPSRWIELNQQEHIKAAGQ